MPSLFVVDVKPTQTTAKPDTSNVAPPPPPPDGKPLTTAEPEVQMYLSIGGQSYGPYDYKTLKSYVPTKQITPETMVWKAGMESWMPAGQVPELKALFAPVQAPPPPPPAGQPPPPPPPMGGMPPMP